MRKHTAYLLPLVVLMAGATSCKGPDSPIRFKDSKVHDICVELWDTDLDGELSYVEAAAVTDNYFFDDEYYSPFAGDEEIRSFDELQYFTGLTRIGKSAFNGCSNLQRITLPETVERIYDEAFEECTALERVKMSARVRIIYTYVFADCYSLREITLPEELEMIGHYAFASTALREVRIPEGVWFIGEGAFMECGFLERVYCPAKPPVLHPDAFLANDPYRTFYVPQGSRDLYVARNSWHPYIGEVEEK